MPRCRDVPPRREYCGKISFKGSHDEMNDHVPSWQPDVRRRWSARAVPDDNRQQGRGEPCGERESDQPRCSDEAFATARHHGGVREGHGIRVGNGQVAGIETRRVRYWGRRRAVARPSARCRRLPVRWRPRIHGPEERRRCDSCSQVDELDEGSSVREALAGRDGQELPQMRPVPF